MNAPPKLSIDGLSRRFGETLALSPTDLTVQAGEFVAIVGPSGCGKSTLFNLVAGIIPPTSGQVLIDGVEVTGNTGNVGYMLQKDLLLPWRTVLENIVLGAVLKGHATRQQREEGCALAMRYGLGDFINHYPAALSGGMRQRVALMRTLAMHRDLMLLDEPFGALDSQTRLAMQDWLLSVWQEQHGTILFVTHDIDEAIFLADRVVVMTPRPGRIREIFDVGIERPRPLSSLTTPAFMALKRKTLDLIYEGGATRFASPSRSMAPETTWHRRILFQVVGPVAALVLLVAFWDFAVWYYAIPRYVMPSPAEVWDHITSDWDALWKGMRTTFVEFLFGFICGAGAGFIFAVVMDSAAFVRSGLYPILIASQAVPIIAISAALTIWLGFGLAPKLVIVGLTVFFPVVVNVLDGLASVDRDMLNLAKSMGGSPVAIFRHIKLPATYTPLFSALKLSATFSVTGAVIGEWTASTSGGLGAYLLQANSRLNTSGTFAAIAFLAALGIASFLLVVVVEALLTPWRSSSTARRWSFRYWHRTDPGAARRTAETASPAP